MNLYILLNEPRNILLFLSKVLIVVLKLAELISRLCTWLLSIMIMIMIEILNYLVGFLNTLRICERSLTCFTWLLA